MTGPQPRPAEPPAAQPRPALPRPVLAAVIGLPVLLATAVAMIAIVMDDGNPPAAGAGTPLTLAAAPAPAAGSPLCAALLATLPERLPSSTAQLIRRPLAAPAPPGAAAWGDGRLAVLRCGVERPAELTQTAVLLQINEVQWLRLPQEPGSSTWVAVDRPVYVGLTVADDAGTGPLQDVSTVIRSTLPVEPVRAAR